MGFDGLLDKTIAVYRATVSTIDDGAYEESFAFFASIKARIQPLSAVELVKMGRQAVDVGIRLYVLPASIQESDRIIYGTRTFEVIGVRDIDEQGRLSTVDCVELL